MINDNRKDKRPRDRLGKVSGKVRGARRVASRKAHNDKQMVFDFSVSSGNDSEAVRKKNRPRKKKRSKKPGWLQRYGSAHLRAIRDIIRKMMASYTATLATLFVIGVVIALPTSLYIFLKNTKAATQGWTDYTQISLYLQSEVSEKQSKQFIDELRQKKVFQEVVYISSEAALEEFQQQAGIAKVLSHLDENPLPAAIILTPVKSHATEVQLQRLTKEFSKHPYILEAKLDFQWVRRLWASINVAETSIWVLTVLFACTVLFVMGNTIRLLIEDQRREIELMKLMGGTDRAIRRPFLYMGVMLGGGAGGVAIIVVSIMLWFLKAPVNDLFTQFHTQLALQGLSLSESIQVIFIGILLGGCGAWLAATWNLRRIRPE